jgi:alpha-amylase
MFTAGGGPGEVHSYFSPFGTPIDAFVTAQAAILDFENRVRLASATANEPFLFHTEIGEKYYTGVTAWSLQEFGSALEKVSLKAIEFHNGRGDFEKWAEKSLRDEFLKEELKEIRRSKIDGDRLRKMLVETAEKRFEKLKQQTQASTRYF